MREAWDSVGNVVEVCMPMSRFGEEASWNEGMAIFLLELNDALFGSRNQKKIYWVVQKLTSLFLKLTQNSLPMMFGSNLKG
jgi:hypothetical protein